MKMKKAAKATHLEEDVIYSEDMKMKKAEQLVRAHEHISTPGGRWMPGENSI